MAYVIVHGFCLRFTSNLSIILICIHVTVLVGRKVREADKLESNSQIRVQKAEFGMKKSIVIRSVGSMVGRMFFNLNAWMIDGIFTSGPKLVPYSNDMKD